MIPTEVETVPDGFKQTEIGLIPEEWEITELGSTCQQRRELVQPTQDGAIRYVGLEHIDSGNLKLNRYGSDAEVRSAKSRFYAGDVLYGKLRPYLDKAVLAEWAGICSTDILVFTAIEEQTAPEFLAHLLHTNEFLTHAINTTSGVNHPRTSWGDIKTFNFARPPLPEQRAIAHVLSKIQAAAETQAAIAKRARELKRALMAKLFTEGLRGEPLKQTDIGLMPEGWEVVKLGERVKVQSGGTPSRGNPEYWNGTIPWVKTGEIDYGLIMDTKEKITPIGLANSSARLLPAGTLLMAMYGQGVTRGRVAILGIETTTNQACAALFPDETLTTEFLYAYLTFAYERVRNMGHGAQQRNLSGEIIKTIKIPVPPLDEQREIARILQTVDAKIAAAERKRAALEELFRAMLGQLMTGRVRVKGLGEGPIGVSTPL